MQFHINQKSTINNSQFLLLISIFSFIFTGCAQEKAYHQMLKTLYKNTVPLIMPDTVKNVITGKSHFVLLDTREIEEYKVSHIRSAKCAGYDHFDVASLEDIAKDDTIIVYCSVGYRSERIGEKLFKEGYSHVYNLYGGIFEWVNKGYPLVDKKGQPTEKIHAYSKFWGKWLIKGQKVYGK